MSLRRRLSAAAIAALTLAALMVIAPVADATSSTVICNLRTFTPKVPHDRRLGDLYDVKALSRSDVWAVGVYGRYQGPRFNRRAFPLIEHWDGRRWEDVAAPRTPNAYDEYLSKLAVISSTDVWAIGDQTRRATMDTSPGGLAGPPVGVLSHGVIDRWNGRRWRQIVLPFGGVATFASISATGPGDVWIVGSWVAHRDRGSHVLPLFLHWNGETWTEEHPDLFPTFRFSTLNDVQATSASSVMAVGSKRQPSGQQVGFSVSLQDGAWVTASAPYLATLSGRWGLSGDGASISQGTNQFTSISASRLSSGGWSSVPTAPLWQISDESAAQVYGTGVVDLGPLNAWLLGSQRDWDPSWEWADADGSFGPAYAEHWGGASWSEVGLPTKPPRGWAWDSPWLNAVDARSGGFMVMVGTVVPPTLKRVGPAGFLTRSDPLIYQGTCG